MINWPDGQSIACMSAYCEGVKGIYSRSGLLNHGLDRIRIEVNRCAVAALIISVVVVGVAELNLAAGTRRCFRFRDAAAGGPL